MLYLFCDSMRIINAFLLLLLVSCSHYGTDRPIYSVDSKKFVLLDTFSTHPGIESDCKLVTSLLIESLKSYGFEPLNIPQEKLTTFIRLALEQVESVYNPKTKTTTPLDRSEYLAALAKIIREHYYYAFLIDSELLLRTATVVDKKIEWDGARLPLKIYHQNKSTRPPRFAKGISLKVETLDAEGEVLDLHFTGITVPYLIYAENNQLRYQMKLSFFNEKMLKKAVKSTLKPFYSKVNITDD